MKYIKQVAIILGITVLGEIIKYFVPLQIPGSIYGLILLFVFLMTGVIKLEQVKGAGDFLVEIMPVLFIPAAVGLMDRTAELSAILLPFLLVVAPCTILVMIVAGKVTDMLMKEDKQDE